MASNEAETTTMDALLTLRKALCENRKRYILMGDRQAINAVNIMLRGIDEKLAALGYSAALMN